MSSCDGVSPIGFRASADHPEGSPIPHAKASSIPLNSGDQPDNWSGLCRELRHEEVSFYLFLLPRPAATPCGEALFVSRIRGRPASPPRVWLMDVSILIQQLVINTTSRYGIHATASRPAQIKVSLRRQTPSRS